MSGSMRSVSGHLASSLIALACLCMTSYCWAEERILYKSIMPNGQVVYSDEPEAKAKRSYAISVEPHPADPQQAEAAQRALAMTREQLLKDAAARSLRLKDLDNQIASAYEELRGRRSDQEAGRQVVEGDRQGRRFSSQYGRRQRSLASETEQAQRKLDKLIKERDALRY